MSLSRQLFTSRPPLSLTSSVETWTLAQGRQVVQAPSLTAVLEAPGHYRFLPHSQDRTRWL